MVQLDYAFDSTTQELRYVDEVPNGMHCHCVCPDCGEPLMAYNNGKVQAHHFTHQSGAEHAINPMTRIHMLAQIIVANSLELKIPYDWRKHVRQVNTLLKEKGLQVNYSPDEIDAKNNLWLVNDVFTDGIREYTKSTSDGGIRYDVYFPKASLGVEIFVTHVVGLDKQAKIKALGDWCIELDLSDIHRDTSYVELSDLIEDYLSCLDFKIFGNVPNQSKCDNIIDSKLSIGLLDTDFDEDSKHSGVYNLSVLRNLYKNFGDDSKITGCLEALSPWYSWPDTKIVNGMYNKLLYEANLDLTFNDLDHFYIVHEIVDAHYENSIWYEPQDLLSFEIHDGNTCNVLFTMKSPV